MTHPASIRRFKHLVLVGLMVSAVISAQSQTLPLADPATPTQKAARPAQARMEATQRLAELKTKLKIEPAQEAAWSSWTATRMPPADLRQRRAAIHAELQQLSTPERIERLKVLRSERNARMDKRGQATLDFYAVLNTEQKKTFDLRMMEHGTRGVSKAG